MYDDFFATAHKLVQEGVPFVTATVVRSEKPTSAKPGDKAIITTDGVMHGWIGGSCAQPTVIREALQALAKDEARLIRLSVEPDDQEPRPGVIELPMTCYSGGTLEIYIEPQYPRPRLLIVGELPVAQALAHLGKAMNYHVVAVDLDGNGASLPGVDELLTSLDGIAEQIRPQTYVVIASHGHYDEFALEQILPLKPVYVGLVASPKRAEGVREFLATKGFSEADLLAFKAPAGLDIQARRGDEIALSIMAEIVQKRRNAELLDLALFKEPAPVNEPIPLTMAGEQVSVGKTAVAIDPICGMEVEITTAKYSHQHHGETFYFCCGGCQTKFAADPEKYLAQP